MFRPSGTSVDAEASPAPLAVGARHWRATWHAGMRRRLRRLTDSPVVRASLQTIAAGLGAQAMLLVSGALSARMLGVDGRGALAALMLWPLMVMLLGTLGVPVACTFFLRDRPALGAEIWGEALRMATVQGILLTAVVGGALFAFTDLRQPGMVAAAGLTLLTVAPLVLHRYGLAVLQGRGRFTAYNVLRTLPNAIYTCSVLALFAGGSTSLTMVVAGNLAACVLACVATLASVHQEITPRWRPVPGLRRQLLSFGLRGHLGAVAPVDGLRLDQAVVAVFLDARAMGLYVAAYAFTNLPRFIAESASRVASPTVADRGGRSEQLRLVRQFFWGVTALIVPRSEEHTSELQSLRHLVCRLLLEKK